MQGIHLTRHAFTGVLSRSLGALLLTLWGPLAGALEVQQITPAGTDVPPGQQIVVRFDRPMVALGSGRAGARAVPVRIRPRVHCDWRWLSPEALACQLPAGAGLAAATRYTVVVDDRWRAHDGSPLASPYEHTFVTERPRVSWQDVRTWHGPGRPVLRVAFSQPVTAASAAQHLFIQTAGDRRHPLVAAAPGTAGLAVLAGNATPEQRARAALLSSRRGEVWLLRPREPLPLDEAIALRVEAGLDSGGPERGIEDAVVGRFHTFGTFRFLGVTCSSVDTGERLSLTPEGLRGPTRCDPQASVALDFSTPTSTRALAAGLRMSPDLAGGRDDFDPWANASPRVYLGRTHQRGTRYHHWLPVGLKAYEDYALGSSPALVDVFARRLAAPLQARLHTAHRRPRVNLVHRQSVLEAGVDSALPAYVTNLDSLTLRFEHLDTRGLRSRRSATVPVPAAPDIAYAFPLPVRSLLEGRSGVLSGEIASTPADRDGASRFFSQVTPFAVTVKLGHLRSLAWVTDLASGAPVVGAEIRLNKGVPRSLQLQDDLDLAIARTGADGVAVLPGISELDPDLALVRQWNDERTALVLRVQHGEDMALLPLTGEYRIWNRQVWPELRPRQGHLRAWGTTAQGVYRPGDRIRYKLYLRDQDADGLAPPPPGRYRLRILDARNQPLAKDREITLNRFGAHHGEVILPAAAAVGWYRFQLLLGEGRSARVLPAFRALVSDFTTAAFRVEVTADRAQVSPGDTLAMNLAARLHAGGPFSNGLGRLVARLRPRPFRSEHPRARGFHFDTGGERERNVLDHRAKLDAAGAVAVPVPLPAVTDIVSGRLEIEGSVQDDRGKSVASRLSLPYHGRDRLVGLSARWTYAQGEVGEVRALVVDASGEPRSGVPVGVQIQRLEVDIARVKGAGDVYQERREQRWVDAGTCTLRSGSEPVVCRFAPQRPGDYRFVASIADTRGRPHRSIRRTYVTGLGHVQWAGEDDAALQIVPERSVARVGETARFLVKNPYPGALALVTLERYGVLRHRVQRLQDSTPVIEVPVEPGDAPGFYLGISVFSPRVAAPPPGRGQVDLGKPAMRTGYLRVPVEGEPRRLSLEVTPEKATSKPREEVQVDIALRQDGDAVGAPVELAVVVLDEAVLDLLGRGARGYDPHAAFHRLEGLDVLSFSLLDRLIGRQKFETKGASAGGDGGGAGPSLRDRFRFVAHWEPSLALDPSGRARLRFRVPDNLTGWRVLAMAVTPGARMGLGEGRFQVNTPTELRPVMPNQLAAGDRAQAGFSVLNRSDRTRTLAVQVEASGPPLAAPVSVNASVTLEPFQRAPVWLPLRVRDAGEVRLRARASDALDGDALEHLLPVLRRARPRVAAARGELADGTPTRLPLDIDEPFRDDSVRLELSLAPSLLSGLDGAFRYMRDYPYACWEQRLSKASTAAQFGRLSGWLDPELRWPDAAGLPAAALADAARFQAPGGGMSYWRPSDDRVSPYLSAFTALAFAWLAEDGESIPEAVETRLHAYLQRELRREFDRSGSAAGVAMDATARAVAIAALARRGGLASDALTRYAPHAPRMSVFGQAHLLQAALDQDPRGVLADELLDRVLGHGEHAGGRFSLQTDADASNAAIHGSALRSQCAALSALATARERRPEDATRLDPLLAGLARSAVASRRSRPHWRSTQENLFCMQALSDYARLRESEPVSARIAVALDGETLATPSLGGRRVPVARVTEQPVALPAELSLTREGDGRIYWKALLHYEPADPDTAAENAGLEVHREVSVRREAGWHLLGSEDAIRRGDVVRVDLFLSVPGRRHFVVVDDPVPGGLEPVNADLATAAATDRDRSPGRTPLDPRSRWHQRPDWQRFGTRHDGFYHRELGHRSVRFFSDALAPGHYHLGYTAQAVASGRFGHASVRAEEMYDPEVYGTGAARTLVVSP